jgi:CDGSH-type Zn-finger protein
MAEVRIRPLKNGPLEVTGKVDVVEADGQLRPSTEESIYLCRCGQSSTKPYCDGTHKQVGFQG